MVRIGGVIDEVDFAQQSLLVMLEFAHHVGGVLGRDEGCDGIA